jgi:hypothetical protein
MDMAVTVSGDEVAAVSSQPADWQGSPFNPPVMAAAASEF